MSTLLEQPSHDGSPLYVPHPARELGETTTLFLRAPAAAGVRRVHARTTPDGEPRFVEATVDSVVGPETWWRVDIEARNPVTRYRFLLDTATGSRWLTAAGLAGHDLPDSTDFRLVTHQPPPGWAADSVVYEIFPDRFARSAGAAARARPDWAIPCDWDTPVIGRGPETPHQFYGGDLDGITAHLDHVERLGANVVYLTPIFPARSNHRYDGSAFDRVDPLLGGDEALVRLARAAHERGMRLVGDITTNHCGDAHPWFLDAVASPAERELFYFDGDDYEAWLGVKSLPKFNWRSPELRRRFVDGPESVAQRWLRPPYNVDGWRVDVANMTGRRGADSYTHDVARALRRAVVEARSDGLLVAEHAHDASADLDRDGWHGTMNYAGFTRPLWSWLRSDELELPDFLGVPGGVPPRGGGELMATMRAFGAARSWSALTTSWNLLGSHDTARIQTVIGDQARLEVAIGLLMTVPGVPMLFAGDELGLEGVNGEDARRPMPWHRPEAWNRATLAAVQRLARLRRRLEALRHGGLRWAHASDDAVAFLRETPAQRLLVLARRRGGPPIRLGLAGVSAAENCYGAAPALVDDSGHVDLPVDGPSFQLWLLH